MKWWADTESYWMVWWEALNITSSHTPQVNGWQQREKEKERRKARETKLIEPTIISFSPKSFVWIQLCQQNMSEKNSFSISTQIMISINIPSSFCYLNVNPRRCFIFHCWGVTMENISIQISTKQEHFIGHNNELCVQVNSIPYGCN